MAFHIGTLRLPTVGTESTCFTILQGGHIYCLTSAACLAPYFNQSEDTVEKVSKILHDDSIIAEFTEVKSLLNFHEAQSFQTMSNRKESRGSDLEEVLRRTSSNTTCNSEQTMRNNLTSCKVLPRPTPSDTTSNSEQTLRNNLPISQKVPRQTSSNRTSNSVPNLRSNVTSCTRLDNEAHKENGAKNCVHLNSVKPDAANHSAEFVEAALLVRDKGTEDEITHTRNFSHRINNVNAKSNADYQGGLDTVGVESAGYDESAESVSLKDSQLKSVKRPAERVVQLSNESIVVTPCFVHKMAEAQRTLSRIFKSQDFKINDRDKSQNELFFYLASVVIIFGTSSSKDNLAPLLQTLQSFLSPPIPGSSVLVVSSPFSQRALRHCWSQGILSCVLTPPVFLTDASLAPGAEGSPVFSADGGLVGMVVCSLFRNQSEVISFSVGVSLLCMFQELGTPALNTCRIEPISPATSRQVILIRCGASWGSGVVLDAQAGIVITCAHVVAANEDIIISYLSDSYPASLVFKSPEDGAFDLALLSTHCEIRHGQSPKLNPREPLLGSCVTCAGYPVFNEYALSPLTATLSSGIISKLHKLPVPPGGITSKLHKTHTYLQRSNTTPSSGDYTTLHSQVVMLQSTCTVHAGVSGGGLFDSGGALVGVMVCNVKSSWGDATGIHPCLNMAVPICAIHAILAEYLKTKDPAVLEALNVANTDVRRIWNLQPIRSKL